MLPVNGMVDVPPARDEGRGQGIGPALFGGWAGGVALGLLALAGGLGWGAAFAAYCLGGTLVLMALALLPLAEVRLSPVGMRPLPRPAYARVRR